MRDNESRLTKDDLGATLVSTYWMMPLFGNDSGL